MYTWFWFHMYLKSGFKSRVPLQFPGHEGLHKDLKALPSVIGRLAKLDDTSFQHLLNLILGQLFLLHEVSMEELGMSDFMSKSVPGGISGCRHLKLLENRQILYEYRLTRFPEGIKKRLYLVKFWSWLSEFSCPSKRSGEFLSRSEYISWIRRSMQLDLATKAVPGHLYLYATTALQ